MAEIRGTSWRAEYGEISERQQFRIGYVNTESWEAYFPINQLADLISVLNGVVSLGLGVLSLGSQVQARKVSTGFRTEVIIEPRSDIFPPPITRFEFSTMSDLVAVLTSLQTLIASDLPADWDNSQPTPIRFTPVDYENIAQSSQLEDALVLQISDPGTPVGAALSATFVRVITADGTDQTSAINAALAEEADAGTRKTVRLVGDFTTTAALVVPSNTTLDASDARITLASGTKSSLVRNAATVPVRTVSGASVEAGSATVVSSSGGFGPADVGRAVAVVGGALRDESIPLEEGYVSSDHVANIESVVNATTVILNRPAGRSVTDTSMYVYNRDVNVTIRGGEWDRGGNGLPVTSAVKEWDLFSTHFAHVDGLRVRDVVLRSAPVAPGNGSGWHLNAYDVSNYVFDSITVECPESVEATDMVHVTGPAFNGVIRNIFGTGGDDAVAVMPIGPPRAVPYSNGPVEGLIVENILARTGTALFKTHGGGGQTVKGLTVRGLRGTAQYAVNIPKNTGDINDFMIEDIDFVHTGTQSPIIFAPKNCVSATIRGVRWRSAAAGMPLLFVQDNATIESLTIENIDVSGDCGDVLAIGSGSIVDHLTLSNVGTKGHASSLLRVLTGTTVRAAFVSNVVAHLRGTNGSCIAVEGTVERLALADVQLTSASDLIGMADGASLPKAIVSRILMSGARRLLSVTASCDLTVNDLEVISPATALVDMRNLTGVSVVVRGRGIQGAHTGLVNINPAAKPRVINPDLSCDVSLIAVNRGDLAYNSNAAGVPYQVGPSVCDGTTWRRVHSAGVQMVNSVVLVAGVATVSDSRVTASSVIRLGVQGAPSGTPGALYVSSLTPGVGYTIRSTSASDTSRVYYEIVSY